MSHDAPDGHVVDPGGGPQMAPNIDVEVVWDILKYQILDEPVFRVDSVEDVQQLDTLLAASHLSKDLELSTDEIAHLLAAFYRHFLIGVLIYCFEHKAEGAAAFHLDESKVGVFVVNVLINRAMITHFKFVKTS